MCYFGAFHDGLIYLLTGQTLSPLPTIGGPRGVGSLGIFPLFGHFHKDRPLNENLNPKGGWALLNHGKGFPRGVG